MSNQGQELQAAPRRPSGLPTQDLTTLNRHNSAGEGEAPSNGENDCTYPCNGITDTGVQEEQVTPTLRNHSDEVTPVAAGQATYHGAESPLQEEWETTSGWTYMGHGEWLPPEEHNPTSEAGSIEWEPVWMQKWWSQNDADIALHQEVIERGYPNRWGACSLVQSKWNLPLFKELLEDYEDREVVEWLKYGWPSGRLPTMEDPTVNTKNHKGATEHPEALHKYIQKEQQHGVVMGPYKHIPFKNKLGISPLSTRPKKESAERRIILDLSFPPGASVNDGMIKDNYMELPAKLTFPRVDDFALWIYTLEEGCMMFKVDLSRYFRQLPLDPGDYSLIGYIIDGEIYFDKVLPMGMRMAPYIAQRVTNAIAFIHRRLSYFLLNYVDDFVGAEKRNIIWQAYQALTRVLEKLWVDVSLEKLVPPTTRLEFLGVTFDSTSMTMEISQEKLEEIKQELQRWLYKQSASRREVEALIGKLQFMAKCIKAGRIFLSRLINWIRGMDRNGQHSIPLEA